MLLTKEQILSASDITIETIEVPEWNGSVRVRALTGKQRGAWQNAIKRVQNGAVDVDMKYMQASLCALAIVDENDRPLFTHDDVQAIAGKSAGVLERVAKVAMRLSGLDNDDMETLKKGSAPTLSADSFSD